jgi:hypothetical protein
VGATRQGWPEKLKMGKILIVETEGHRMRPIGDKGLYWCETCALYHGLIIERRLILNPTFGCSENLSDPDEYAELSSVEAAMLRGVALLANQSRTSPQLTEEQIEMTNRFISFLKKAGQILVAAEPIEAELLPQLAPLLNLALPQKSQAAAVAVENTAQSEIGLMTQNVLAAETMANTLAASGTTVTGAQKAAAAAVGIKTILENSQAMAGKKIASPTGALAAAEKIAGALADWWNAVDGSSLPTVASSTAPAPAAPAPAAAPAGIPTE